ncbi:hypothetical protein SRHO_G00083510 [Serrasalmus rhombeus]
MTYKSRECGTGGKSETLPRTSDFILLSTEGRHLMNPAGTGLGWSGQCHVRSPESGEPRFHCHEERHNGRFWIKDVPVTLKSRVGLHFTIVQKSLHHALPQRTYIVNTHSKNWRTGDTSHSDLREEACSQAPPALLAARVFLRC